MLHDNGSTLAVLNLSGSVIVKLWTSEQLMRAGRSAPGRVLKLLQLRELDLDDGDWSRGRGHIHHVRRDDLNTETEVSLLGETR